MGRDRRQRRRHREQDPLPAVPSDFIVPPPPPPGFGIIQPQFQRETPLITGQVYFDDPFYSLLPPPPFGSSDPCYPAWLSMKKKEEARFEACEIGKETAECQLARRAYFDAAREYSTVLDRVYGLSRFQTKQTTAPSQGAGKQKNRTC